MTPRFGSPHNRSPGCIDKPFRSEWLNLDRKEPWNTNQNKVSPVTQTTPGSPSDAVALLAARHSTSAD